ncbi:MAG: cobalt transporter CbiM [Treponema sp.]|jgi:cobalt/nickel transport system permease protein|nr:cobalt transporter CbiM [Treponema sp.]
MHISEGVLSMPVIAAGWALSAGGLAVGLKKTHTDDLSRIALVSSVLFLASLVHVPVGPSSIHLTLLGLAGALLGWSVIPALFIALLLQGLLFQFGGLLSLGVNAAVMSLAALSGRGISQLCRGGARVPGAFLAGFTAVIAGSILVVLCLFLSDYNLASAAAIIFAANIPLAVVEGIVTVFMVLFFAKVFPSLLPGAGKDGVHPPIRK